MELSEKMDRFMMHDWLTDAATGTVVRERKVADVRGASLSEEVEADSEFVLKTK
jgi:hypothetical protein